MTIISGAIFRLALYFEFLVAEVKLTLFSLLHIHYASLRLKGFAEIKADISRE